MFAPLPDKPDHPALELELLELWEREGTFAALRARNEGGPIWSFVDGPVTANRFALGVHTAWGRTLKDVFQRYKALRGFDQRYQNGFDCQGLWIEVGVERELGLNSKPEIEEYGLEAFARKCRDVVVRSSAALTRGSKRLGQWMDWGNDYFTFSDTNIEYIWKFLKLVHARGWLVKGHRSTEWCPRCGTSLSQHELTQAGVYQDRADPSLFVRLPLLDRAGESLVVWTTTPWTLPANVAAAVHPDEEYGRREDGEWVAVKLFADDTFLERRRGAELVGWRYGGPFDDLPPGSRVEHRVIPWEDVTMDQGTGVVHIAPGAGPEDFELSRVHDLPVLTPVDESGRFYDDYGWLHGLSTTEAADQIIGRLGELGLLAEAGLYTHAYPHCWRCDTPLIFRIADDWFIAVDEIRPKLLEENAKVRWVPEYMGKRMDDWLRNMGDWNISRRRYYGLPLPFYPCSCGHLNVIGSKAELEQRALEGFDQLEELRRPWVDRVPIACERCGERVERIPEVGDVWLDAGIVPFATLGWENPTRIPEGYATGAAKGLTKADLPDHAYWERWFPADWVSEMREQIRLWFYSQFFMSVVLTGRSPYRRVLGYEKMLDEQGREMHSSWGNTIDAEDAFAQMGADVMRWQYCAQPPDRNLLFGFGPAHEIKRKLLTYWHSVKFLVDYANIEGYEPAWSTFGLIDDPQAARPLAARADEAAGGRGDGGLRGDAHRRRDPLIRVVRRRLVELVHPAIPTSVLLARRGRVRNALVRARPVVAGDRPDAAVPRRPPVAQPRAGRSGVGASRRLARSGGTRREPARGDGAGAPGRRARPSGTVDERAEAASAAPAARGRRSSRRSCTAHRRDRGRAAREGGDVRRGRVVGAAREAEPAGARPEARCGAPGRPRATRAGRVRRAGRRSLPCRRARARAGRSPRRARRPRGLGRRERRRCDGRSRHGTR